MIKNYFILNRISVEASADLNGFTITEIFSQEKEKIILHCKNGAEEIFIEICVNPGLPYFTVRDEFHRAKKNSISFFDDCLPAKISGIMTSNRDRVIKIILDSAAIFFAVRGRFTNATLIRKDGTVEYFKTPDEDISEEFAAEMAEAEFIDHFNLPQFELSGTDDPYFILKKNYPFVGKDIIAEVKSRTDSVNTEDIIFSLISVLKEIKSGAPAVFLDKASGEYRLGTASMKIFSGMEKAGFENIFEAVNYYLGRKYYSDQLNSKLKKITRHLERELRKVTSKLNEISGVIERGSREEEYRKLANLLLINIGSVKSGAAEALINDIYDSGKEIKIKLDPSLSPKKNVDRYFEKSRDERIRQEKSAKLLIDLKTQYERLKSIESRLKTNETMEEYNKIMKELKIKDEEQQQKKEDLSAKFRHYLIDGRYNVYVGKDSANNDLLTTRFAKQNDYWFHARSVPGSHVVLRVENSKEAVPKNILKKAAALAAYHSKAKTSGLAPVSFAFKKYVVKKKGMEPGKVALLKEDVLLVKPEIPQGCEYISGE